MLSIKISFLGRAYFLAYLAHAQMNFHLQHVKQCRKYRHYKSVLKNYVWYMIMPLFKSTITKWHIFTPDFARRGSAVRQCFSGEMPNLFF